MERCSLKKFFLKSGICALALCITTQAWSAAIPMTGASGSYTQNFDSLPASGAFTLQTIQRFLAGGLLEPVPLPLVSQLLEMGARNSGGIYSFGTGTNTDRALGSVASGTSDSIAYGAYFVNNTQSTITSVSIGYTGEQWRNGGNTTAQSIIFSYRVDGSGFTTPVAGTSVTPTTPSGWTAFPSLDFNSLVNTASGAALNGNANSTSFSATTLTGLSLAPDQVLWIRWDDSNNAGSDHGLAVDNVSELDCECRSRTEQCALRRSRHPSAMIFTVRRRRNTSR